MLRSSLEHVGTQLESETLCAVLLLGIFETLRNRQRDHAMLRHAHGAAELIKLRGPQRHNDPFERAMLLAAQGPLSTESICKGSGSPLDSQVWRKLVSTVPSTSVLEEDRPCQKLKFVNGHSFPQLIADCLTALQLRPSSQEQSIAVFTQAERFRLKFFQWSAAQKVVNQPPQVLAVCAPSTRAPSADSHLLVMALRATMLSSATLDVGAFGNFFGWLIVTNKVLICLHPIVSYDYQSEGMPAYLERENLFLAQQAFETAKFLQEKRPAGLLYYDFSLRVARATLEMSKQWMSLVCAMRQGMNCLEEHDINLELQLLNEWLKKTSASG